jgi:soluble lytic murein transglycosylase-like protein/outer membrane protein assembly factor BamD (BamD/ComL family)
MKNYLFTILIILICSVAFFAQTYNDATLQNVRQKDVQSRDAKGKLTTLSVSEHIYRADVYSTNRAFPEAREHWDKVLQNYQNDAVNMPKALFGTGRSYMWEREYALAITFFDDLVRQYITAKDGREGLAFKGSCLVRLGRNAEAADIYRQYTTMFPTGERIDSAYLNTIDALREAGKYDEANIWVDKTRQRFVGSTPEVNALFARLRMEIFRGKWDNAIKSADDLRMLNNFSGSMTSMDEVVFLKAYALEKNGKKAEAINFYSAIPDSAVSYFGGIATEKLNNLLDASKRQIVYDRQSKMRVSATKMSATYPVLYKNELLRFAKSRNIDPRFVLSIMKQESSFKANAKSASAARGLLQLVMDTALKYNKQCGLPSLQAEQLYTPEININIGSYYIGELKRQFSIYEAIAASYNGGEDNAQRWLNRSKPKENAIFTSEVGFSESKNYVFKVMNNYRVYRELYTEDLRRK